jgi:hypothetical protein
MTARQTVDIPSSRRLTIDVPREIPVGRAIVTFKPVPEDETEYLLRSPNAEVLLKSVENINKGEHIIFFESLEAATQAVLDRAKH